MYGPIIKIFLYFNRVNNFLKQFFAIILSLVFLSAQYGKVSNYYHCIIVNAVEAEPDCDCQAILMDVSAAEKNIPLTPAHVHTISLDEFFVQPLQDNGSGNFKEITGLNPFFTDNYTISVCSQFFRPPECC
jgi:hypothetical protein